MKFIAYYRVSTAQQGASGLGLEAQQTAVTNFLSTQDKAELIGEFVEVESGGKAKRPKLDEAIRQCKQQKARLLIAKLDRLARNVHFVSGLMESGADFVACDNPNANKFMVQIMAVFAEHERDQISQRTKDALRQARARGVELGKNGKVLGEKNQKSADDHARLIAPKIALIPPNERATVATLTAALNNYQIPTPKGGRWHRPSTQRLLSRLNSLNLQID